MGMNPSDQPLKLEVSSAQLLADLHATFPGIFARPLREFGTRWAEVDGIWTGGEVTMPDGMPMFNSFACPDPDDYNGRVHQAFEAWLEARGWYAALIAE